MRHRLLTLLLAVGVMNVAVVIHATPGSETEGTSAACGWVSGFWSGDLDREVNALAVFDDGTGSALYAGGYLQYAGGVEMHGVAKWDGSAWTPIDGPNGFWTDGLVFALEVIDHGGGEVLYAGGGDGSGRPVVARWDGDHWTELGTLTHPQPGTVVESLAGYDDGSGTALFAGGGFLDADGVTANYIAKWNGTTWEGLSGASGTGTDGRVLALEVFDDGAGSALFIGGWFTEAGGQVVNAIAKWDGAEWHSLPGPSGVGTDNQVNALEVWDDGTGPALYVGGSFNTSGGIHTLRIAKWDGSTWSALSGPSGTGISGGYFWVYDLAVFDEGSGEQLYAAGDFALAGGLETHNIARWDGSVWSAVEGPAGNGTSHKVNALAMFDDGTGAGLYAAGDFDLAGGRPVGKIARWKDGSWSALSPSTGHGLGSSVFALETYDDGTGTVVVAAGSFQRAGGIPASIIAAWEGNEWSSLDGPSGNGIVPGTVYALEVWDRGGGPELYAGGSFSIAGGVPARNIASWDGTQWSALVGSSDDWSSGVRGMAVFDDGGGPALFVVGSFTRISGVDANRIAKWNGSGWSPLVGSFGEGLDDWAWGLAVFDDGRGPALFVGGAFDTAGGVSSPRVARWDGSDWTSVVGLGGGIDGWWVDDLAVYDDGGGPDLYAAGLFDNAGGATVNNLARWNGASWTSVGGHAGVGLEGGGATSLEVFDDGGGVALYVGGYFDSAGDVAANSVARWDGLAWSALDGPAGNGTDPTVWAMKGLERNGSAELNVGGYLSAAGGVASDRFAVWRCTEAPLFADGFELGDSSAWSSTQP